MAADDRQLDQFHLPVPARIGSRLLVPIAAQRLPAKRLHKLPGSLFVVTTATPNNWLHSVAPTVGALGDIGRVGGNQSDFGCSRAERLRESLSLPGGIVKIGC